jgi:hypothetical protein
MVTLLKHILEVICSNLGRDSDNTVVSRLLVSPNKLRDGTLDQATTLFLRIFSNALLTNIVSECYYWQPLNVRIT